MGKIFFENPSNYILVEKYADDRSSTTWNDTVGQALIGLPVKVVQVTSDEAPGLICTATKGLSANHSPDTFHVPYEIGKGTSGALAAKVRQAEKEHETTTKNTQKEILKKEKYEESKQLPRGKRPKGRKPNFDKKIAETKELEQQAKII